MKKLLFLAVAVSALLACTNKNDAELTANSLLGKQFRLKDYYETSYSYAEMTNVISFPSSKVCHIHFWGTEYDYDGDKDKWNIEENLSYTIEGNTIITEEISEWGYGLTLTYSGGNLIDGSDVYVYDGTVDLDPSLDNTVLPEGKRSYIPEGWYESGRAESWFEINVKGYIQAGDIEGVAREANSNPYLGDYTAIHIADENTIEFAAATCSTQKPSTGYYATKNYRDWENNYTVYFYYTYATETLKYKMVDDVVYVKTDQGWLKYSIVVSNNIIADLTYKKINYSGGYAW